jgi:hypothetical protein
MRLAPIALTALLLASCSGVQAPALPTFELPQVELPSFDTAAIQDLVDDALAEVDRVATDPPELPADLQRLLDENQIELPGVPTNAHEICDVLGVPGVGSLASAGLATLIEELIVGAELGLVVGLLAVVTVKTCPVWMPHLESAVEQVL